MTLLAAAMSPTGGYAALLPGVALLSLGQGIAWTAMFVAASTGVDAAHQGIASAMASTTHQIGGAVGLAVLIAVAGLGHPDTTGAAMVSGLRVAGWVAAALTLPGVGIALTLRRSRDAAPTVEAAPQPASIS
ncbi:hypothetical protein [Actinoplanes sp. M2I2]|uniref:hypothetical protein n=1 Tax=Actinoplanes sp. M2I2 TaxID=1734444 RepID=UPI002022595C|nr:hypothetical protein [Actinoplanes sp. M2I2]